MRLKAAPLLTALLIITWSSAPCAADQSASGLPQVANKKGSTRVGGSGSSGKGSHYVNRQKTSKAKPPPRRK